MTKYSLAILALLTLVGPAAHSQPVPAPLAALDPDNDGTISLDEAKAAASAKFEALDTDHDGKLDKKELVGTLGGSGLAKADPDHDGTLTKDEWLALVETKFNAANPDKDGTIDAKELRSPAGRALLKLLHR